MALKSARRKSKAHHESEPTYVQYRVRSELANNPDHLHAIPFLLAIITQVKLYVYFSNYYLVFV